VAGPESPAILGEEDGLWRGGGKERRERRERRERDISGKGMECPLPLQPS
jgi:hypothetical protein